MPSALRLYVPVYSITLILSAYLLFSIQPLTGKMLLPLLGGSPQVWNSAMLFFQAVLLAGYAYAHTTTHFFNIRVQATIHLVLLSLFVLVLPIAVPDGWRPPETENPIFWQLSIMTVMIGGPFFVLAGSAPILQRWFAHTDHPDSHNPYFLYAASNLGSMTALLAYPFLVEPMMTIPQQSEGWTALYMLLISMTAIATLLIWKRNSIPGRKIPADDKGRAVTWRDRSTWILLAFLPSSLMLGVTTYITTDLAAFPLLWVMPLALYVGTFILAFARRIKIPAKIVLGIHAVLLVLIISLFFHNYIGNQVILIGLHLALFFFSALLCHMELVAAKPRASHLTEFYLFMSFGGVLGGIFNALIAPIILVMPIEYPLILAVIAFMRYRQSPDQPLTRQHILSALIRHWLPIGIIITASIASMVYFYHPGIVMLIAIIVSVSLLFLSKRRIPFAIGIAIALALHPGFPILNHERTLHNARNYFGITRVTNSESGMMRFFFHGTTVHGTQPQIDPYRLVPLSYYHPQGPAGDIFGLLDRRPGTQRVGAIGLGVGSIACYTRSNRTYDFYEIDPAVVRIAEDPEYFTYLKDCGSEYQIIMGDGRLRLEDAEDGIYDLIFMDAFSSDNIPIHLITLEAFDSYLQKLRPGGIIAVNISNRYLNLRPVMNAAGNALGITVMFKFSGGAVITEDIRAYSSLYAVFITDPAHIRHFADAGWTTLGWHPDTEFRVWTDNYANPFSAMWAARLKSSPN